MAAGPQRRELIFVGHVQGVGFRATTASLARRHAVRGFVRNLDDGSVEVAVEGDTAQIDAFVQALRSVFDRHIRDTRERTLPATGEFTAFDVRY